MGHRSYRNNYNTKLQEFFSVQGCIPHEANWIYSNVTSDWRRQHETCKACTVSKRVSPRFMVCYSSTEACELIMQDVCNVDWFWWKWWWYFLIWWWICAGYWGVLVKISTVMWPCWVAVILKSHEDFFPAHPHSEISAESKASIVLVRRRLDLKNLSLHKCLIWMSYHTL